MVTARNDVKVWDGSAWVQSRFVKLDSSIARRAISELGTFVDWLNTNNAQGIIGEVGWANDHNAAGDGAKWNTDAEAYLNYLATCGVRGGMDFCNWVGSSDWASSAGVPGYVLAYYFTDSTKGDTLIGAGTQTAASEPFYGIMGPRCGINMSDPVHNAEPQVDGIASPVSPSGFFNSSNPGVYGTDYWWPKASDFAFLAGRGVKTANVRFRWERLQPALLGALDTNELDRMTDAINAAAANGISVILTPQNGYGYMLGTGPASFDMWSISQAGTVNVTHFVDLWTRISVAVGSLSGLRGYGLCNEPTFMGCGIPTGSNLVTNGSFDTDLSGGWTTDAGASSVAWNSDGHSASGSCLVTANGSQTFASVVAPRILVSPGDEYHFECWFKQPSAQTALNCEMSVNYFTSGGSYVGSAPSQGIRKTTTTQWQQCTTAVIVPAGVGQIQLAGTMLQPAAGSTILVDDFIAKACTNTLLPAPLWEYLSQQAVTVLRNAGDTHEIWVNGFGNSVYNIPVNHPAPWIADSLDLTYYDAHHYWDHAGSSGGSYTSTYAAELAFEDGLGY
jgi:hypothetical protein